MRNIVILEGIVQSHPVFLAGEARFEVLSDGQCIRVRYDADKSETLGPDVHVRLYGRLSEDGHVQATRLKELGVKTW